MKGFSVKRWLTYENHLRSCRTYHATRSCSLCLPLLLVYTNNLCNGRFKGKLVAFADDTALFYKTESIEILKLNIRYDVNELNWWFMRNFMIMSPKYILFNLTRIIHLPLRYHDDTCISLDCNGLKFIKLMKLNTGSSRGVRRFKGKNYLPWWVGTSTFFSLKLQIIVCHLMKKVYYQ